LICALGSQRLVAVLIRCGLALPTYFLADEKHSHCLTVKVYFPTIVRGRIIWHLGCTPEASTAALTQSYGVFQRAAFQQEPAYRVRGILTDGFDSTTKSMRTLFPGDAPGPLLAPYGHQAARKTRRDRVACPPSLALPVSHPLVPGPTAQRFARMCAGPTVAPLCRSRHCHGWDGQWRACAALDSGEESGLVCGARRSTDAGDQHPAGSSPSYHRAETVRDERVSPPRRKPTGVSHGVRAPVPPDPLSASGEAYRSMRGGSERRAITPHGLVPQCPNPHLWRLSMSGDALHHEMR
jgi:hypothetical protein